ncbi:hypothetical protein HHI36_017482 [Cryptolaemus montrouzieri]|uniref:Ionotropic receptor n=1 Tax=Cryptolaemus montrouzieri TaxID=559131 RepID=A0ABD2NNG1_9CUCU
MIDWVSIVRHSRRRFSNYVYGVPHKVRRKRLSKKGSGLNSQHSNVPKCTCCWSDKMQSRYAEEEMPPPPSPPTLREIAKIDGISREGSLERTINRRTSLDKEQTPAKEIHKPNLQLIQCMNTLVSCHRPFDVALVNSEDVITLPVVRMDCMGNFEEFEREPKKRISFYIINCQESFIEALFESLSSRNSLNASAIFLFKLEFISSTLVDILQTYHIMNAFVLNSLTGRIFTFEARELFSSGPRLIFLGSCTDIFRLSENLQHWILSRKTKRWKVSTLNICYDVNEPYTLDSTSYWKGSSVEIYSLIFEAMDVDFELKLISISHQQNQVEHIKVIRNLMKNKTCLYFMPVPLYNYGGLFDTTFPFANDFLSWFVPSSKKMPRWKYVYELLSINVWYSWIISWSLLILFWYLLTHTLEETPTNLSDKMFVLYQLFFEQGNSHKSKYFTETIIILVVIFGSFLMNMIYKCNFAYFLTGIRYVNEIESIEDVMALNFKIGFTRHWIRLFGHDRNFLEYLEENYVVCDMHYACVNRTAFSRDMAVLKFDSKIFFMSHQYVDEDGKWLLKKIDSAAPMVMLAMISLPDYPLLAEVNRQTLNVLAHGLVNKSVLKYIRRSKFENPNFLRSRLSFYHLKMPFYMWTIGILISVIVFLREYIIPTKMNSSSQLRKVFPR